MPGHVDTWQYDLRIGSRTFHLYRKRKAHMAHVSVREVLSCILLAFLLYLLIYHSCQLRPYP
jgi:hypothetical protein